MSSLIHPTKLALPAHNFNDTLLATLKSGKKCPNTVSCDNNDNEGQKQATHLKNTELYEKPIFLVIIFLMFELNLFVHLYCANYLMSHL